MTEKKNKNSAARIAANHRYNAKTYDSISLIVPKGKKAVIKAAATSQNESLNQYINKAIDARIDSEN